VIVDLRIRYVAEHVFVISGNCGTYGPGCKVPGFQTHCGDKSPGWCGTKKVPTVHNGNGWSTFGKSFSGWNSGKSKGNAGSGGFSIQGKSLGKSGGFNVQSKGFGGSNNMKGGFGSFSFSRR
jgi:hypothetical protein